MTELTAENSAASAVQPETQAAPPVTLNPVTREDIRDALRAGLADFRSAPRYGLFFGAVFSLGGILIAWALLSGSVGPWVLPAAAGFPLIGPFAAVGLYEVSRRLEAGEPLSWGAVLGAGFLRSGGQLPLFMVFAVFAFLVWIVIARVIFAVSFGTATITNVSSTFEIFFTGNGLVMLVIGTIVGAALAGLLFAVSAISVPMMLDRPVDVVTAMITSVQAVLENRDAMGFWAMMIVGAIVVAMLPLFVGMILVFPVLGHASWHVYRKGAAR